MSDIDIIDLFKRVKEAWNPRQQVIDDAVMLRTDKYVVAVPEAWQQTAKQHPSSRAKEIPTRITGTLMLNKPIYSRANPGEDFGVGEDQNQVERFHQAHQSYWDKHAMKGRSALEFMYDSFVGKGAACMGSILTPHRWAGAPLLYEGENLRREFWRDSSGRETEDESKVDLEAAIRAHGRAIEKYRQSASGNRSMPLSRRLLPPEQVFPMIHEGEMVGFFIERKVSLLELNAKGWVLDLDNANVGASHYIVEAVTPNRCRYYLDEDPIAHKDYGSEGLYTGYGFIPYVYQTSLSAGETEYGSWGLPVLGLIESNLKTIQTLRTYLMNAVHLASFTSFYIEYVGEEKSIGSLVDNKTGKKLTTFEFKSGTIMDFGPGRKVVPLTHPGLNADFWKALAAEEQDVDRIIPRTLSGEPGSSGYNTVVSSVQARALYNSIYRASELLLEQAGEMDMRHVSDSLPGPVYCEWEKPSSGRAKQFERVKLSKELIGNYYHLQVDIDRVIDPITEGTFRANMIGHGIGDIEWAAEGAGIHDYEDMLARQARDRVFQSEQTMMVLDNAAIERFKLKKALSRAAMAARIQQAPDGTPVVQLPDGRVAGPGFGIQSPMMQGAAGAMGGANNNPALQSNGGPNMEATNNPGISQPKPTPTNRGRGRRRGGAVPNGPQRQPHRPEPSNPAA